MKKRIRILFSGQVQGVGFRFMAESIAKTLGVAGWVRNLHDGGVEVVAEGEEGVLKDLISRLQDQFSGYIQNTEMIWENPTGEFKEFGVRF